MHWTLEVHGGLSGHINRTISGTVDHLTIDASETISTGMFFGLDRSHVSASAADVLVTKEGINSSSSQLYNRIEPLVFLLFLIIYSK